jgi:hypothetical protein
MYESKAEQKKEFLSIREKYLKPEGGINYSKLFKYFKSKGTPISDMTLRKWEKQYQKSLESTIDVDFEKFLKTIKEASGRNPQFATLYAKLKGYTEKPKEASTDYTNEDISRGAEQFVTYIRENYKDSGICPCCLRPSILPDQVCSDKVN